MIRKLTAYLRMLRIRKIKRERSVKLFREMQAMYEHCEKTRWKK